MCSFKIFQQMPTRSGTPLHDRGTHGLNHLTAACSQMPVRFPTFQPRDLFLAPRYSRLPASPLQPPGSLCLDAFLTSRSPNKHLWVLSRPTPPASLWEALAAASTQRCHFCVPTAPPTNFQHYTCTLHRDFSQDTVSQLISKFLGIPITSLNTREVAGTSKNVCYLFSLMGTPRVSGATPCLWRASMAKQLNMYKEYLGFGNTKEFEF